MEARVPVMEGFVALALVLARSEAWLARLLAGLGVAESNSGSRANYFPMRLE